MEPRIGWRDKVGTKDRMKRQSLVQRIGWRDKAWNQGKDGETKLGTKERVERQSLEPRIG